MKFFLVYKGFQVNICDTTGTRKSHYCDVIMGAMVSQITRLTIVYATVYSDADQRKHQSSASLSFVREITGDRWIRRTNGQKRGKGFHSMTSSRFCVSPSISSQGEYHCMVMVFVVTVCNTNILYGHFLCWLWAWINDYMPSKVWDEITYPFPNFNCATVELWGWISNFSSHIMMAVITYPCWD